MAWTKLDGAKSNLDRPVHAHAHFDLPPGEPHHDAPMIDIEHVPVDDDPRDWPELKKTLVLLMVSTISLLPTTGASIYNPAFTQLREQLHATETELSLSVSMFILLQGSIPVVWSSIAEVTGRKGIYLISIALSLLGTIIASRANNMILLIFMRCLQAFGSSAVLAIGAGSLADMYEKHERGSKMGVYYGIPLLGMSLGPVIGGILANAFDWRATFYFLAAFAGVGFAVFIFFPDSWRRERSTLYQRATRQAIRRALAHDEHAQKKRDKKMRKGLTSSDPTPGTTVPPTPRTGAHTPESEREGSLNGEERDAEAGVMDGVIVDTANGGGGLVAQKVEVNMNAKTVAVQRIAKKPSRRMPWARVKSVDANGEEHAKIKLSLADVNPVPAMWAILKKPGNLLAVISSGLLFAVQYTVAFTAAVTFGEAPYNYNALKIGLVILAFGGGNVAGSVLGGRYSDIVLARLKKQNGGVGEPEMRLQSTYAAMVLMIPSFLVYAWTCEYKVNIAGPVIALFFAGFSIMVIYSSTLAYLVDANPGRSSSAIACNSMFRGVCACVASQVALSIRNAIGDGGLYTLFSGILVFSCLGFIVIIRKGKQWRHPDWRWRSKKITTEEKVGY